MKGFSVVFLLIVCMHTCYVDLRIFILFFLMMLFFCFENCKKLRSEDVKILSEEYK